MTVEPESNVWHVWVHNHTQIGEPCPAIILGWQQAVHVQIPHSPWYAMLAAQMASRNLVILWRPADLLVPLRDASPVATVKGRRRAVSHAWVVGDSGNRTQPALVIDRRSTGAGWEMQIARSSGDLTALVGWEPSDKIRPVSDDRWS